MPRWWFSIRYCPTESLNWETCPARLAAGVCLCGCMPYARREVRDVTRLRMAFSKENDSHGHDRLFVLGSKSFCCTAAIHSARLCGSFGKEKTPVPGRSCTSTTSATDHHTRLRHFLGEIAYRRSKKKARKKQRTLMAYTSATSKLSIKQWNARTMKFWGTEVSSHNSRHEPP